MSQLVVPDLGEVRLLSLLLQRAFLVANDFDIGLWTDGPPPNRVSVLGDYTEATFDGYARKVLDRTKWTDPITVDGAATSYYDLNFLEWLTASGSQVVKGYFVLDGNTGVMLWLEQFDSSVLVTVNQPCLVQPMLRLRSQVEPLPP